MDGWNSWFDGPPTDFPRFRAGDASVFPRRWTVLALLLVACFIPRFLAAWNWDALWGDSLLYLRASTALDQGDFHGAFDDLGLNTYPVILCWLRKLGPDWQCIAKWWSVLVATAVVLPLFGWVRRQFDDRVAILACLCYAIHGKLVAVSPLAIRDPTFWLLFMLTIYLSWRSIVEIRFWLFLAAGLTLTLAIHTRTEGWVLVIPLVCGCACRLRAVAGARTRLVAGTAMCLVVLPLSVTLINATWLRESPHWEMGLPSRLTDIFWRSWRPSEEGSPALTAASNATATDPVGSPRAAAAAPLLSEFECDRKLAVRLVKGYTYIGGLLALIGLAGYGRIFLRWEHQAMLLMELALVALIRIRFTLAGVDIRYFLPLVIVACPCMALGLFHLRQWMLWLSKAFVAWNPGRRVALLWGLVAVAAILSLPELRLPAARGMRRDMLLGQWILDHVGPAQGIGGGPQDMTIVGYYAHGSPLGSFDPRQYVDGSSPPVLQAARPEVVLLGTDDADRQSCRVVAEKLTRPAPLCYRQVPEDLLPGDCRTVTVLVRGDKQLR